MNGKTIYRYLNITFIAGILFMLAGCGGYEIPMHKNKTSAFLHKKDMLSEAYRIRLDQPTVYWYKDHIFIAVYRESRSPHSQYLGFEITTVKGKPTVDRSWLNAGDLDVHKMSSKYYDAIRTFRKQPKWPTYWALIYHPDFPKIYFRWKPTSTDYVKTVKYDEGILEVMLLSKGAGSQEKAFFNYFVKKFQDNKTIFLEKERAARRASNAYGNYLLRAFSSQLSSAIDTTFSNDTKGIQIKYQGYNKSNGNYVYNLKYNGSYDGQIFYYPNNGGYTIMTVGVRHGQSVNGDFADGRLYTPQCGHTTADNIDDAIKKAVNCIYKRSY